MMKLSNIYHTLPYLVAIDFPLVLLSNYHTQFSLDKKYH